MEIKSSMRLLSIFVFFMFGNSQAKLVPALYVFGDSTVDAGNINDTDSTAPYGIDFPGGHSGRLTNGYTVPDFLGKWLGLDGLPPPYFKNAKSKYTKILQGFNYACRSSGILNETGTDFGRLWSLGDQVQRFKETLGCLPKNLSSNATLSKYLSRSIYFVAAGGNDYALNYILRENNTDPKLSEPFAKSLVSLLGTHLEDLYKLGARKFVVSDIGPLGCLPISKILKPGKVRCIYDLNSMAHIYNKKLDKELKQLTSKLKNSTFVRLKSFNFALDLLKNPTRYGINDSKTPCCEVLKTFMKDPLLPPGVCMPKKPPCANRSQHAFFDGIHPSETMNKAMALPCFNGSKVCVPVNVQELARK